METSTISVVGATGDLGFRITKALIARNAKVRAIIRKNTSKVCKVSSISCCMG